MRWPASAARSRRTCRPSCSSTATRSRCAARRGFGPERLAAVKQMHRLLYRSGKTLEQARADIEALAATTPEAKVDVDLMLGFLSQSTRGIAR